MSAPRHPQIDFQTDRFGRAIAPDVEIAEGVHLGNNITLYPGVRLGRGAVVMDNAVVGRIPLGTKGTTLSVESAFKTLDIGENTVIGTNAVVYTGSVIGNDTLIADGANIREGANIADEVVVGRYTTLLYDVTLKQGVRIHDLVHVVGHSVIEEHVFISPSVVMANDNNIYLTRYGIEPVELAGITIRKYAVVALGVNIIPGIEIGKGAFVGTGAVVTKDVEPWMIVAGVPAKPVRPVPDDWREKVLAKFGE